MFRRAGKPRLGMRTGHPAEGDRECACSADLGKTHGAEAISKLIERVPNVQRVLSFGAQ
jgi:hypothetical protein